MNASIKVKGVVCPMFMRRNCSTGAVRSGDENMAYKTSIIKDAATPKTEPSVTETVRLIDASKSIGPSQSCTKSHGLPPSVKAIMADVMAVSRKLKPITSTMRQIMMIRIDVGVAK